ncbi:MAG: hypothetical protein M3179_14115 [Actinomycetota bacterium]|nr:hypothetical protein [Actinomycetota bacterium]
MRARGVSEGDEQPGDHHEIERGVRFRRHGLAEGYTVRCSCGWQSEVCATPAFAEAAGEQHLEMKRPSPRRGR